MTKPYHFRILAQLPGQSPIEIMRTHEKYSNHTWLFWTRGMAPEWTVWSEHPMDDRECISPRPQTRIRGTLATSKHHLKIASYA